jgi:hypothetical protein
MLSPCDPTFNAREAASKDRQFVWYNLNNGVVTTSRFAFRSPVDRYSTQSGVHTVYLSLSSVIFGEARGSGQEKILNFAICAKRLKLQRGRSSVG